MRQSAPRSRSRLGKPLRPLIIDNDARAKALRVLAHASAHLYSANCGWVPGDDERFVAHLNTYRVVFTFTLEKGKVWRHLSVSVPGGLYPHPSAVLVIAELFGFTGWDGHTLDNMPDGWVFHLDDQDHCIVVAQEKGDA